MKWKGSLGRTILLVVLAGVLLGGCDFFAGLFNPLIGTWHTTITSGSTQITQDATLKADGSLSVVMSDGTSTQTKTGTWTSDAGAKTLTFVISSPGPTETQVWGYAISSDRNTLTLTFQSTTGTSTPPSQLTFTRTA